MAESTCLHCGRTSFEVKRVEPRNSMYVLMFVQCSSCGGVVGVLEHEVTSGLLHRQNEAVKKIARQLQVSVDL